LPSRALPSALVSLAFIGAAALLCSCRSLQADGGYRQPNPFFITDDLRLPLLDTALLDAPLDLAQNVKGSYGGKTYFLVAYAKADSGSIDMVGLDAMGTQVFDLAYAKSKGIRFFSPVGLPGSSPEYLVADFQLAYYPFAALRDALAPRGLELTESGEGSTRERRLSRAGREIVKIEYSPGLLRYENELRGYSYEIRVAE
jgi:hypothetical protein